MNKKILEHDDEELDLLSQQIQKFTKTNKIIQQQQILPQSFTDIPKESISLAEYWQILEEQILPFTVNVSDPKFIGHMTSQIPRFQGKMAELISLLNQNVVKIETSQILTFVERQCIALLHKQIFGCENLFYENIVHDANTVIGSVVSNGSLANTMAMWIARNKALNGNKNCSDDGLHECLIEKDYKGAAILCSSFAHYSVQKIASLIGLGKKNIIQIETDDCGKILISDLHSKILECKKKKICIIAIWGIAGTTELGSVDNLPAIAALTKEYNIHFHVDAAWGGIFALSQQLKSRIKGIEYADSVTICGHKQFFLPQGISMLLSRNCEDFKYIETYAQYQARKNSFDLGRWSIEGSRPAHILYLHAALHCIAQNGYTELLGNSVHMANVFKAKIQNDDCFELVQDPQLNIVTYRYIPCCLRKTPHWGYSDIAHEEANKINEEIQQQQWNTGKSFVSRTTIKLPKYNNRTTVVLRAVLINPDTTEKDLDFILSEQKRIAKKIEVEQEVCSC